MTRRASIFVLNYNGKDLLAEYLPSLVEAVEYDGGGYEIVVVDNASSDDSVAFVQEHFPTVRVQVKAENRQLFSYNQVVAECKTDYVILLNNDINVERDFIAPLMCHFEDPLVFAVMPKVLSSKRGEQFVYRCPGRFECGVMATGRNEKLEGPGYTLFAHGGVAAYDRKKFLALGGFDPLYWPNYYEDVDLSYHSWMRGWVTLFEPMSQIFHYGQSTVDKEYSSDGIRRQREKVRTIFVLKNITDREMLGSFFLWSALRLGKSIATFDRPRLAAYWDTLLLLPKIYKARLKVQKERLLSDDAILQRLRSGDV